MIFIYASSVMKIFEQLLDGLCTDIRGPQKMNPTDFGDLININ